MGACVGRLPRPTSAPAIELYSEGVDADAGSLPIASVVDRLFALMSVDDGDVVVLDLEGPAGIDRDRRHAGKGQIQRQIRDV